MKFKFDIIFQSIGDSYIAVPVGPGAEDCHSYIHINESTYFIASRLKQGLSEEEIASEFTEVYDIDRDTALHYIGETLHHLHHIGFLA